MPQHRARGMRERSVGRNAVHRADATAVLSGAAAEVRGAPAVAATFSGRARVATRVRLNDTGTVLAVAQLSDGSFWSASAHVVVTLSACLEELI